MTALCEWVTANPYLRLSLHDAGISVIKFWLHACHQYYSPICQMKINCTWYYNPHLDSWPAAFVKKRYLKLALPHTCMGRPYGTWAPICVWDSHTHVGRGGNASSMNECSGGASTITSIGQPLLQVTFHPSPFRSVGSKKAETASVIMSFFLSSGLVAGAL